VDHHSGQRAGQANKREAVPLSYDIGGSGGMYNVQEYPC
jgi:hypothetical protein